MSRYLRNAAVVLLVLFVSSAVFAGGGAEEAAEDGVVEIRWLQWWEQEWGPELHASIIERFEEANPGIRVTVIDVPWPEMSPRLQAAAVGGETYDIIGIERSWVSSLVAQDYIEDLGPWLEEDSEFRASLAEDAPWNFFGTTPGLALYLIPYQYAYNTTAFDEYGLEAPENWEEFVSVLEALRDEGVYGMSMPLSDPSFIITRLFGLRLAQEGGSWFDDDGNVAFNSQAGVDALNWWKEFYEMDLIPDGALTEDQATMLEFLAAEQIAGVIDGPFIQPKAEAINDDIQLAYAPAWDLDTGGYSLSSSGLAIAAGSEHKEEAWLFLKHLYSEEIAVQMTQEVNLPWATNAALEYIDEEGGDDPMLRYVPQYFTQDPANNIQEPMVPEADLLFTTFQTAFNEAITGRTPVTQALDEAAEVWQNAIDEYRGN